MNKGCFINDDFGAFFESRDPSKMNESGLREQIDFYAGKGGVRAVIFNMNASRAYFDSKTFDPIWKGVDFRSDGSLWFHGREVVDIKPEPPIRTMCSNAHLLYKNFGNPMAFRYKYCHELGTEMWHGMRMNDNHWSPDPELPQHAEFWYDHPEYQVGGYLRGYSYQWELFALNYWEKEVRDHKMALLKEYLEHECDGIEIDWLRSLPVFRRGFAARGRERMNDFVREIRRLANEAAARWGHPVKIMMRVPGDPQTALRNGLDVQLWAREGLFDILEPDVAYSFCPIELWKQLLPDGIEVLGGITHLVSSGTGGNITTCCEMDYGIASDLYCNGADTIYLFNHFWAGCGYENRSLQPLTYAIAGDRERVNAQARRHPFMPFPEERTLPPRVWAKSSVSFTIHAGEATAGRKARVMLVGNMPITADVIVNGTKCRFLPDAALPDPLPTVPQGKERHFAVFSIPDNVLTDGANGIDVINQTVTDFELFWAEIDIDPQ